MESEKIERLKDIILSGRSAVVALSGGIDSTLLGDLAHELLGERALSVTVLSEFFIPYEKEYVEEFLRTRGARHEYLPITVLSDEAVAANPPERCYLCKRAVFENLLRLASERGYSALLDGTNTDDLDEDRPGLRALHELGVRSPYVEAGVSKRDIIELARERGLGRYIRPSNTCLATRITVHTKITPEILGMVERAERRLRSMGFQAVRVRYHEPAVARIEVPVTELAGLFEDETLSAIRKGFREIGFRRTSIDVDGYGGL